MANNSDDIRRLMNLVESIQEPILLEGWVQGLRDKLGDKKAARLGAAERAKMADRLTKEYFAWLGQTNRSGNTQDLTRFMSARIGFTDADIDAVMGSNEPADNVSDTSAPEDDEPQAEPTPELEKAGVQVEPDNHEQEPDEEVDDPRQYQDNDGKWDQGKILSKLRTMPPGAKLTLGKSSFFKGKNQKVFNGEPIEEATASEVVSRKEVRSIMDRAAARINDEYLLNGPKNDQAAIAADTAGKTKGRPAPAAAEPKDKGKLPSGQYDVKEILYTLVNSLEVPKAHISSMTNHVAMAEKSGKGFSRMTKSDQELLAKIGYAFIKSRT